MNYFPAFFDLRERRALIVGGGEIAARRLRLLLKAGAKVTVVAPRIVEEIEIAISDGTVAAIRRGFVAGDIGGHTVVFSATGREDVDERVAEAARTAGVPVNVTDRAELSSFIVPAIVERDPVVIGISTGGAAPVLASRVRESIERLLPARLGRLAEFASSPTRAPRYSRVFSVRKTSSPEVTAGAVPPLTRRSRRRRAGVLRASAATGAGS